MILAGAIPRDENEAREARRFAEDLRVLLLQFGELRPELKLAQLIHVVTKGVAGELELGDLLSFVAGSLVAAEEKLRASL